MLVLVLSVRTRVGTRVYVRIWVRVCVRVCARIWFRQGLGQGLGQALGEHVLKAGVSFLVRDLHGLGVVGVRTGFGVGVRC